MTTHRSALEPWPDTVDWRPVSPLLIWVEILQMLLGVGIVLFGCLIAWVVSDSALVPVAIIGIALYSLVRAVVSVRAVLSWGYAERERDLLVRHGRLIRRLSIVPYSRMQFIDVTAGPLERTFGLASVQMHTAAAASDARIPG